MTKNEAISLMIIGKVSQGMTIREAIDAILGEGTVEKIASDLYDTFREEAAAKA